MKLSDQYFEQIQAGNSRIFQENRETLEKLGAVIGRSIGNGGVLHTFGSGHSAILARELVHRGRVAWLKSAPLSTPPAAGWRPCPVTEPGWWKSTIRYTT